MVFVINITFEDSLQQQSIEVKPADLIKDVITVASRHLSRTEDPAKYGFFLPHATDPTKGLWLDPSRPISFYQMITKSSTLLFMKKFVLLSIKTLDGGEKQMEVDGSRIVGELMMEICAKTGIVNYEEYSLAREISTANEDRPDAPPPTPGIGSSSSATKMKQLKKKVKTDDAVAWLNHIHTLREQGLYENLDEQPLVLRRKFFLSDQNVDTRDTVQLTLLYVQCVDGITSGRYPVTQKEAVMLAALQLYVEQGIGVELNSPSISWDDFLPKEYRGKGLKKEIHERYEALGEIVQADARLKYVQTCRQLRTYGVATFLVKEKKEEKQKLRPILLGITRESVVRIDPKNREVLQEWQLTMIKSWTLRATVFQLDFGSYDKPYSVQTQDMEQGQQIVRLLTGYIDIIMKRMKALEDQAAQEEQEQRGPIGFQINPGKATMRRVHFAGGRGDSNDEPQSPTSSASSQISDVTDGQANNTTHPPIPKGAFKLPLAEIPKLRPVAKKVPEPEPVAPVRQDGDAADYVNIDPQQKPPEQFSFEEVTSSVVVAAERILNQSHTAETGVEEGLLIFADGLAKSSSQLIGLLRKLATDDDDAQKQRFLKAARQLAEAAIRLVGCSEAHSKKRNPLENRQQILDEANRIREIVTSLVDQASAVPPEESALEEAASNAQEQYDSASKRLAEPLPPQRDLQQIDWAATLKQLTDRVSATSITIAHALSAIAMVNSNASNEDVSKSLAAECAVLHDVMVAIAMHMHPVVEDARTVAALQQSVDAQRVIVSSTKAFLESLQEFISVSQLEDGHNRNPVVRQKKLRGAANAVGQTGADLIVISNGPTVVQAEQSETVDRIKGEAAKVMEAVDPGDIAAGGNNLAQDTRLLASLFKLKADAETDELQKSRFLVAARKLADAASKMFEVASSPSSPTPTSFQDSVKQAAEKIRTIVLEGVSVDRRVDQVKLPPRGQITKAQQLALNNATASEKPPQKSEPKPPPPPTPSRRPPPPTPPKPASTAGKLEKELMNAAEQISAIAKKLNEMQPAQKVTDLSGKATEVPAVKVQTHSNIIDACRILANSAQSLVRSASRAQSELLAQGRMAPVDTLYVADDSQWSQGLISAAKFVAEATQKLCESADQLLHGTGTEEGVIAAAKQVASCTAHLVLACQVKADLNSATFSGLQTSAQAVKTATDSLVAIVQRLIANNATPQDTDELSEAPGSVKSIATVIKLREDVLRRERELEEARRNLAKLNQGHYKFDGDNEA